MTPFSMVPCDEHFVDENGMTVEEIIYRSAVSIAEMIRNRRVSSEEVVRSFLDRIEKVNPQLNAVVQLARDRALAEAR